MASYARNGLSFLHGTITQKVEEATGLILSKGASKPIWACYNKEGASLGSLHGTFYLQQKFSTTLAVVTLTVAPGTADATIDAAIIEIMRL